MKFITLLPLLSVAFASPLDERDYCRPSRKTYVAKYDDLPFVEPGPNPIPNPYNGLTYTTFQVDQYDGFIPPTSGNQWTMAFGGSGNISVTWLNIRSPAKETYALESFSFACVSGVPQPECAISMWGFKSSGKPIKRVIKFPALGPAPIDAYVMNRTTFGREWSDLKSVGFSIARADNGGDMFGGLALDDVKYTVKKSC
ncbi:hypothetical protein EJ04DRAFT_498160 [Polyplosphaeria fusca]|uniref:Uncharacterized protein n=1 Tax=Polyplosphaeria fusca TaxID=682080 RepID=A0A9P4V057_9PLEO|nr:hypothetical protein EJ04DRAFT_498160 [Polyplosphaeria fusca]